MWNENFVQLFVIIKRTKVKKGKFLFYVCVNCVLCNMQTLLYMPSIYALENSVVYGNS